MDSFGINYLYSFVICQIGGEDHGIVSKASNDYCMKHLGVNDVLDGYILDFHMIVPRGISIDEVVDMWSESWEEKVNESCTSRV